MQLGKIPFLADLVVIAPRGLVEHKLDLVWCECLRPVHDLQISVEAVVHVCPTTVAYDSDALVVGVT